MDWSQCETNASLVATCEPSDAIKDTIAHPQAIVHEESALDQTATGKPVPVQPEPPAEEVAAHPKVIGLDISSIPHSLRVVTGMAEQENYFVRIKEVHKLRNNLSDEEIKTLYVLLNRKSGEDNLQPGQMNALKNDVVNVLRRQETTPEHLHAT